MVLSFATTPNSSLEPGFIFFNNAIDFATGFRQRCESFEEMTSARRHHEFFLLIIQFRFFGVNRIAQSQHGLTAVLFLFYKLK